MKLIDTVEVSNILKINRSNVPILCRLGKLVTKHNPVTCPGNKKLYSLNDVLELKKSNEESLVGYIKTKEIIKLRKNDSLTKKLKIYSLGYINTGKYFKVSDAEEYLNSDIIYENKTPVEPHKLISNNGAKINRYINFFDERKISSCMDSNSINIRSYALQ